MAESMSAAFLMHWTGERASNRGADLRLRFRRWRDGSARLALMASVAAHALVAALFLTDNAVTVETGQPIYVEIVAEASLPASDAANLDETVAAGEVVTEANAEEASLLAPDTTATETDVEPPAASVDNTESLDVPDAPTPLADSTEPPAQPANDLSGQSPSPLSKPEPVAQEITAVTSPNGSLPIPPRRPAKPAGWIPNPAPQEPEPTARVGPITINKDAAKVPNDAGFEHDPLKAKASRATRTAALGGQQTKALAASGNPRPLYPARAVRKGLEGRVILDVEVLATGRVGEIKIAESSGFGLLDRAAIKGVRKWRFKPARLAGIDVRSRVRVPVRFELER